MKKVLFLMLFLTIVGMAGMNAQVTIGDNREPHPGAVLDLQYNDAGSDKGLLLPNVYLMDVFVPLLNLFYKRSIHYP